jgi:signal transduction histidine kinase
LAREQVARHEAETANRAKDEFLAMLSHELRTPLGAILGWARMLRGGTLDETAAAHALEVIERNTHVQTRLIEDLLDVSRIVSDKLSLEVRPVDLVRVAEAAIDAVRSAAEAKGVRLDAALDPSAGPVAGDAGRLQQVVWNLLTNAIKFTLQGGRVGVRLEGFQLHVARPVEPAELAAVVAKLAGRTATG